MSVILLGRSTSHARSLSMRAQSQVDAQGVRKVGPGAYTLHLVGGQPKHVKAVSARLRVTSRQNSASRNYEKPPQ